MDAEEQVLETFPEAEAREIPPILLHGADHPVEIGYWGIFAGPEFDSKELGRGTSKQEAWSDAARLQGNEAA